MGLAPSPPTPLPMGEGCDWRGRCGIRFAAGTGGHIGTLPRLTTAPTPTLPRERGRGTQTQGWYPTPLRYPLRGRKRGDIPRGPTVMLRERKQEEISQAVGRLLSHCENIPKIENFVKSCKI